MAELVAAFGVPHTPLLWRLRDNPDARDLAPVFEHYRIVAEMLRRARPDALVVVASDHFHQYTFENMPAFAIGKAEHIRGTHPNEERTFGLPPVDLHGDVDMAEAIAGRNELVGEIDFAFSNRPWLDHAYIVPLLELTPAFDVPVVPIHTNTNAPPIPSVDRFVALGRHLRRAIAESPVDRRIALVASGHLAFELGGPRQFTGTSPDPAFDGEVVSLMERGDLDALRAVATFDRLRAAGNLGFQFLDFVTLLAATGKPPDLARGVSCRFGSEPFFAWEAP